jgi:hypothetical protein
MLMRNRQVYVGQEHRWIMLCHVLHNFVSEDDSIRLIDIMPMCNNSIKMPVIDMTIMCVVYTNAGDMFILDDLDPDTMNDMVEIDGKMGKKKQLKIQAKAEKRQQREVYRLLNRNDDSMVVAFSFVFVDCFQQELVERRERKEREEKLTEERRQREQEEEQREREQVE